MIRVTAEELGDLRLRLLAIAIGHSDDRRLAGACQVAAKALRHLETAVREPLPGSALCLLQQVEVSHMTIGDALALLAYHEAKGSTQPRRAKRSKRHARGPNRTGNDDAHRAQRRA